MSYKTSYKVEIAGTKALDVVTDREQLRTLMMKLLEATGKLAYENVQSNINMETFKHSEGRLHRGLKWEKKDNAVYVYFDDRVAPHAVYQEKGVRPHTMRYLLQADSPIPIQVGNVTLFRWATEKWMERPHPLVDPKSGLVFMTKGWQHPGYEGRWFMREGFRDAVRAMSERAPRFVFRMIEMGDSGGSSL